MDHALRADLARTLHDLADRLADDRASLGELAGAVTRIDEELAEIRDELVGLSATVGQIAGERDREREGELLVRDPAAWAAVAAEGRKHA